MNQAQPEIYPREWEKITTWVNRLRVPGGWIVHSCNLIQDGESRQSAMAESMTFVPDPAHSWILEPKKNGGES